jgi:peptidoglycan/LPS O-acetylase OafA/YrhL
VGAIRLFLALGVVFSHTIVQILTPLNLPASGLWSFNILGGRSVAFFYVVSGFLISYVLSHKYNETSSGTLAFFRGRAARIFPLWLIVLIASAFIGPNPWIGSHSVAQLASSAVLLGSDWIIAFWAYPSNYWENFPHAAGVGWTLGAELTFYLIAPWVLRSMRATLVLLAISFAIRLCVFALVGPANQLLYVTWSYFFFPATLMFFLLGHLARRLLEHFPLGLAVSLALLAAALLCSSLDLPPISVDRPWSYLSCICFAASLPGIFAATKDNRFLNYLGDLTYPVYLVHTAVIAAIFWPWGFFADTAHWVIETGKALLSPVADSVFILLFIISAVIAAAAVTRRAIEIPARWLFEQVLDVFSAVRRSAPQATR